jgi:hypothetical protein
MTQQHQQDDILRAIAEVRALEAERDAYKGMHEAAHAMRGDAEVEALKAEAFAAALRDALVWIATVNAKARAAIGEKK